MLLIARLDRDQSIGAVTMATFRFTFPPSAAGLGYTIRDASGGTVDTGTLGTSADTQGPVVLVKTGLAADASYEAEATNASTYYSSRAVGALDVPATLESISGGGDAFSGSYEDLADVPTSFPPEAHTHSASDVDSGTFAAARIPSLAQSKINGLSAALSDLDRVAAHVDPATGTVEDVVNALVAAGLMASA